METQQQVTATQQQVDQVRKALENPEYTWRTISDIAGETQQSPEVVRAALKALRNEVIQSDIPSENEEDLFTTRSHYRNRTSWLRRAFAALKNRAT